MEYKCDPQHQMIPMGGCSFITIRIPPRTTIYPDYVLHNLARLRVLDMSEQEIDEAALRIEAEGYVDALRSFMLNNMSQMRRVYWQFLLAGLIR